MERSSEEEKAKKLSAERKSNFGTDGKSTAALRSCFLMEQTIRVQRYFGR